jgi:immunity protein Imm1 of predicted polymorphic toxin system
MQIEVSFRTLPTGEVVVNADSAEAVHTLVDRLASGEAGSAAVTHHDREPWNGNPDHEFVVAFREPEHAAMSYFDRDTPLRYSRGEEFDEGENWGDENIEPPANAWVSRATVEKALTEFLQTAQRPTAVEWQADPDPLSDLT